MASKQVMDKRGTRFFTVVLVICRSPLIHIEVDSKLSLALLSRPRLIFKPRVMVVSESVWKAQIYIQETLNTSFPLVVALTALVR
jgi:hypothetical protein